MREAVYKIATYLEQVPSNEADASACTASTKSYYASGCRIVALVFEEFRGRENVCRIPTKTFSGWVINAEIS